MSEQIVLPSVEGAEFRLVEGKPGYCVGDNGSVWSRVKSSRNGNVKFKDWVQMKATPQSRGHLTLWLGRNDQRFVHRLVLEHFVGPCPDGMECLHEDGNPANNRLGNLSWGTPKQNHADSVRHGTAYFRPGMECPTRILDDADVLEIVSLCRCGMSQSEAAQKFNVHETNVNSIMTGRSWSSLTGIKYIVKRPGRKGEKRQKLSDDAVLELRELASAGWTRKALSERSGLHVVTVGMIISGQRRASVKREQLAPCV